MQTAVRFVEAESGSIVSKNVFFGLAVVAGICGAGHACAQADATRDADSVHGLVFVDDNNNGRHDSGERALPDVKISNGRDIALSDAQGSYRLPLRAGDTVFMIKPAGYDARRRDDGLPATWHHHFPQGSPPLRYGGIEETSIAKADFALVTQAAADDRGLDVLVFGDPQPKRTADVDYFRRDIVEPLAAQPGAALGLSLGDIVDDDLSLYPGMVSATTSLGLPWLHLPGNHDLDFDAPRDEDSLLTYRAHFGPDTYAWEERDASFILFDDVIYQPAPQPGYIGGLREDQFEFLAAYLATLPRHRRLVVAAHIPFHDAQPGRETFRRADRERLFGLLAPFANVLLLTSHAHAQRHNFHGEKDGWRGAHPLHEYVVGASCGGFWSGLPDEAGIPDARMTDGTPNGYARLHIDGADYRLRWHAARDAADTRIALSAPKVLRQGAYPAFVVTANVFMGMDDTRVEYRIDDGQWQPMQRQPRPDPQLLALNAQDDASPILRSYDRFVEATPSPHLWRGALPTDLPLGEHRIEVRAFDRWDGELRAATSYRLDAYVAP
jgi:hypothetical protein